MPPPPTGAVESSRASAARTAPRTAVSTFSRSRKRTSAFAGWTLTSHGGGRRLDLQEEARAKALDDRRPERLIHEPQENGIPEGTAIHEGVAAPSPRARGVGALDEPPDPNGAGLAFHGNERRGEVSPELADPTEPVPRRGEIHGGAAIRLEPEADGGVREREEHERFARGPRLGGRSPEELRARREVMEQRPDRHRRAAPARHVIHAADAPRSRPAPSPPLPG